MLDTYPTIIQVGLPVPLLRTDNLPLLSRPVAASSTVRQAALRLSRDSASFFNFTTVHLDMTEI